MVLEKINLPLIPMKAHYFFNNAGISPIVPFVPTIARQIGFSPLQVGGLYAVLPVASLLAKPACGALADRLHLHKTFFLAAIAFTAISLFSIVFIPESPVVPMTNASLDCGPMTNLLVCEDKFNCARNRLVEDTSKEIVECRVQCSLSQGDTSWTELCETWNITQYCYDNSHNLSINMDKLNEETSSQSSVNRLLTVKKDLVPQIEFVAKVPLEHTIQIDSCLFLRVSSVIFPDNVSRVPFCNHISREVCGISCDSVKVTEAISAAKVYSDSSDPSATLIPQFWLFCILILLGWIGMAVSVSIGDAICFEMLGDKPSHYGRQRVWGAVGWGTFAPLAGFLVDHWSRGQTRKNYTPVFYLSLVLLLVDFLCSTKLKHSEKKMSASIVRDVGRLLLELKIVVFLCWCVIVGMGTGLVWQFLFWHLEDLAGAQDSCITVSWVKTLEGLVMGIQCFGGEIPFFFLSGKILKIVGHERTMSLVLFAFGVRLICYSLLTNPWWGLPIELLNGVTFGLSYATMASYASVVAPPGTEATVQGLVGAVFEGVGVSLGSLLSGALIGQYGGTVAFRIFGIGAFCASVLHEAITYTLKRSRSHHSPEFQHAGDFGDSTHYSSPSEAVRILDRNETYGARKPILIRSS